MVATAETDQKSRRAWRLDVLMDRLRGCGLGQAASVLSISRKAAATLFLLAFFDSFLICELILLLDKVFLVFKPVKDIRMRMGDSFDGFHFPYRGALRVQERD